tara:strand:+ start:528 stop:1955 length:1428 start_codon:yes stop_codon:yes gene_type:complete
MGNRIDFGVVGLGVMGRSLALNMIDRGLVVGGADLATDLVDAFVNEGGESALGFSTAHDLISAIERPRKLLMMVPAGPAVDSVLDDLYKVLEPGDVVIDGGNSKYQDTQRRVKAAEKYGVLYVGAGVSGGEEGARHGPSIMPSGSEIAWDLIKSNLQSIAARGPDGQPCCDWLGGGGCGHAVKTIHNGIEYAFMQAICEIYAILNKHPGTSPDQLADLFGAWNTGHMKCFLLEITEQIFRVNDPFQDGKLVNSVLDEAKQKGTGKWTAEMALDLGVPCPTLAEAVFARGVSSRRSIRDQLAEVSAKYPNPDHDLNIESDDLKDALFASVVIAFAQGLDLIASASAEHGWEVRLDRVAKLWRAGCIIRIDFLDQISQAMQGIGSSHLLLDPWFSKHVAAALPGLRRTVSAAAQSGIGIPVLSSALSYYDTIHASRLPHNLLQAQRDAFGAHSYRRNDREGDFHTDWLGDGSTSKLK